MTSSSDKQRNRIRRASSGEGWYFGEKLRDRRLYRNRIIARFPDLSGCSAADVQRALRADAGAGIDGPRMWITSDDEDYFDDEECAIEPVSFGLTGNSLSMLFEFTTSTWMAPDRESAKAADFIDDDAWYDEYAAAAAVLSSLLKPYLERNRASLELVEADTNYLSPPWRWRAEATVETRGRSVNDIVALGRDSIALAEAFGDNGVITRSIAADLVRSGHAGALIGQSEGDWLDVKRQHYDFGTAVGKIKLAQAVAKFANAEQGGVLIIGMLGKKVPGGEVIHKMSPVPIDGETVRRYRRTIGERLYPPPDLLGIEIVGGPDCGVVLIDIPSQPEELKPFLVHGAIIDGDAVGTFISIVRRRGEESIPITAPMIHSTLAAGRALMRRGQL